MQELNKQQESKLEEKSKKVNRERRKDIQRTNK